MSSVTWLLSSGGRRGALVEILKKAPSGSKESRVVVTDMSPLSAAGYLADTFELVPPVNDALFIDEVARIALEHEIDVIVPAIDPEIAVFANNRERFDALGMSVWVSSPAVAQLGWDKWELFQWLTAHGIPTVETLERDDLGLADLTGPVVAKPRTGSSSIGVIFANDISELDISNLGSEYIVQRRAPGVELTIDFAVDKHGRFLGAVPRRRLEVRAGEVSKGVTVRAQAVESVVRELSIALPGAYGILNAQVFCDSKTGEINVIEINPRVGGGLPLSFAAGADFASVLIRSDAGERVSVEWEPGTVMLRYDNAVFHRSADYVSNPWK